MKPRGLRICLLALLAVVGLPTAGQAAEPVPTVRGPITGGIWGHALFDSWYDLGEVGYTEAEYFVSGNARQTGAPTVTAPFTTRMIVSRPIDPQRFNGTVLVDWTNVTAQFENPVDTLETRELLLREGFAFVHASIQAAGVCCIPLTPKIWDPLRYAELNHPGDTYAFDILTQLARSFRSRGGVDPMDGLQVEKVLAAGQSQSASQLSRYVRDVQPGANAIDGFLIHGGGSKAFAPPPSVPVMHLLSDAEASPADPTTTTNYRLWEVAGTAHSDMWIGYAQVRGQGPRTLAHVPKESAAAAEQLNEVAGNYGDHITPLSAVCVVFGDLFPMRYAASAALHHLNNWVRGGDAPPVAPRYAFDAEGNLARDANLNALGGIRLPPIVAPVAHYVSDACGLGGLTIPFTPLQLQQLYPTHADYFAKIQQATAESVRDGFLLPKDAQDMLRRACGAAVPSFILRSTNCYQSGTQR